MFTKEDYISLETAKLLKEKGFNEPCNASVLKNGTLRVHDKLQSWEDMMHTNDEYLEFLSPTLYEVQKWLRQTHGVFVNVYRFGMYEWSWIFSSSHKTQMSYDPYKTYEQALEAGIRTALILI